jgi:hypothetical protein
MSFGFIPPFETYIHLHPPMGSLSVDGSGGYLLLLRNKGARGHSVCLIRENRLNKQRHCGPKLNPHGEVKRGV